MNLAQDKDPFQTRLEEEHRTIIRRKTVFLKLLVEELRALGAEVVCKTVGATIKDWSGFWVNQFHFSGSYEGFVVTPIAAKGRAFSDFSSPGDWSGTFLVTLHLGFANRYARTKTWRSKKDGVLPVKEIAAAVLKAANDLNDRDKRFEENANARLDLKESSEFKALSETVSESRYAHLEVDQEGKSVSLKFDRLPVGRASALMAAFQALVSQDDEE